MASISEHVGPVGRRPVVRPEPYETSLAVPDVRPLHGSLHGPARLAKRPLTGSLQPPGRSGADFAVTSSSHASVSAASFGFSFLYAAHSSAFR